MKVKINKALLASLPTSIASIVAEFRATTRKSSISVDRRSSFWIQEDAKYTAFGPDGRSITVRAGGEFAGVTDLLPGRECKLPENCLVIETGRFCGLAFLNVYENPSLLRSIEGRSAIDYRQPSTLAIEG